MLVLLPGCKEAADTAVPKLEKELLSKESSKRNQAALALAAYGPDAKKAIPALTRRLQDENSGVRTSAAFALRSIGTAEAERALESYQK